MLTFTFCDLTFGVYMSAFPNCAQCASDILWAESLYLPQNVQWMVANSSEQQKTKALKIKDANGNVLHDGAISG